MKTRINRGRMLAFAGAVSIAALSSNPAFAQSEITDTALAACQATVASTGAESFFDVSHMIPGLPLPCEDLAELRAGRPVIYATFNTNELREEIAEHGVDSDRIRRFIDRRLSKEGENFRIIVRFGGHIYVVDRTKGVDVDSNITSIAVYIIANDSNGQPVYAHTAQGANWQSIWSNAMASMAAGLGTNVGTVAASRLIPQQGCGNNCGPSQTFNIQGGNATAEGGNAAIAANFAQTFEVGTGCATGTCPFTPPVVPHGGAAPVGVVQPGTNGPQ